MMKKLFIIFPLLAFALCFARVMADCGDCKAESACPYSEAACSSDKDCDGDRDYAGCDEGISDCDKSSDDCGDCNEGGDGCGDCDGCPDCGECEYWGECEESGEWDTFHHWDPGEALGRTVRLDFEFQSANGEKDSFSVSTAAEFFEYHVNALSRNGEQGMSVEGCLRYADEDESRMMLSCSLEMGGLGENGEHHAELRNSVIVEIGGKSVQLAKFANRTLKVEAVEIN